MLKIDQKIVSQRIVEETPAPKEQEPARLEPYTRPRVVEGRTYKLKIPTQENALYVTINDVVMDDGTRRPIEIFLNSKNMQNFQWITALTRLVSSIFRQPLDFAFMIEELKSVFDPTGGHFLPNGGGLCPSVVANIGLIIEDHCKHIGLIETPELDDSTKAHLEKKAEQAKEQGVKGTKCPKCGEMAMVRMDNCETCLSCAWSKCG